MGIPHIHNKRCKDTFKSRYFTISSLYVLIKISLNKMNIPVKVITLIYNVLRFVFFCIAMSLTKTNVKKSLITFKILYYILNSTFF